LLRTSIRPQSAQAPVLLGLEAARDATIAAIVSGECFVFFRSLDIADIRAGVEDSFILSLIFAQNSGERGRRLLAALILARRSAENTCPVMAAPIFARCSADSVRVLPFGQGITASTSR
jgi:hypothetical protein